MLHPIDLANESGKIYRQGSNAPGIIKMEEMLSLSMATPT
jgi:hypothetical protein